MKMSARTLLCFFGVFMALATQVLGTSPLLVQLHLAIYYHSFHKFIHLDVCLSLVEVFAVLKHVRCQDVLHLAQLPVTDSFNDSY